MLKDCDYILTKEGGFYIVKGYWNDKKVIAAKVFAEDKNGGRYNTELKRNYKKISFSDCSQEILSLSTVRREYKPQIALKEKKESLKGTVWHEVLYELVRAGIGESDIGIMGSYLLGFEIKKDVDFIVYGIENCKLLKEKMPSVIKRLGATEISNEHIAYQAKKYSSLHNQESNSFGLTLQNKWSSIQIKPGLLSTIRFGYKDNEIPRNIFDNNTKEEIEVTGIVKEDLYTNFCPRYFTINSNGEEYTIGTYFWPYQACVKKGQKVKVTGMLRDNNVVAIENEKHGIRIIQ